MGKNFITHKIYWGVYAGESVKDFVDFETKINAKSHFIATFIHWGNNQDFPTELATYAKNNQKTLVMFWEPLDYNNPSPIDNIYSYDHILKGEWDGYIDKFKDDIKSYGDPVILIPFEEMNGDWYPWSITKNNNSPQKHIAAYQYIRNKFRDTPNVKFGWSINNDSVPDTPQNDPINLYPGNDYVDYIGVNGFNFDNPWQSFTEVFDNSIKKISNFNKPIIIFSTASAPGPLKPVWIRELKNYIDKNRQIYGFIWFNENKEKDWEVWSDTNSLMEFQKIVSQ